jgi:hypothetical protein
MNAKNRIATSTTAKQRLAATRLALAIASKNTVMGTLSRWATLQILNRLQIMRSSTTEDKSDKS